MEGRERGEKGRKDEAIREEGEKTRKGLPAGGVSGEIKGCVTKAHWRGIHLSRDETGLVRAGGKLGGNLGGRLGG